MSLKRWVPKTVAINPAELWGLGIRTLTEFQDLGRKEREGHPEVVGGECRVQEGMGHCQYFTLLLT